MLYSHILVPSSFYEGLPLVVLEGLASGCRIVATDLPGAKDILGNFETDTITLVRTPRLRFIDQPYREDEYSFEQNLKKQFNNRLVLHPSVRKLIYQKFRKNLTLIPGQAYLKKSEKNTCLV